jgi:hypothetical protein
MKNDLVGQKFNRLKVIGFSHKKHSNNYWYCICDCGIEALKNTTELKTGKIKSCGCLRRENHAKGTRAILEGRKFGLLTVIKFADTNKDGTRWFCKCDCGVEKIIPNRSLNNGQTVSCGCRGSTLSFLAQINIILSSYKNRARKKQLEFLLSHSKFESLIKSPCYYCGIEDSNLQKDGPHNFKYNGIDRVDNSQGYIETNVVTCCKKCNIAKSTMGQDEFINFIKRVFNYCSNRIDKLN